VDDFVNTVVVGDAPGGGAGSAGFASAAQLNLTLPAHWKPYLEATGVIAPDGLWPPADFDWRDYGKVSAVKDQGSCGSCYTFSSSGVLESARAIATGELGNLSAQQVLDCSAGPRNDGSRANFGCRGGVVPDTLRWIKAFGGLCAEKDYPAYSATQRACYVGESQSVGGCAAVAARGGAAAGGRAVSARGRHAAALPRRLRLHLHAHL
jgi:hypothetical protein